MSVFLHYLQYSVLFGGFFCFCFLWSCLVFVVFCCFLLTTQWKRPPVYDERVWMRLWRQEEENWLLWRWGAFKYHVNFAPNGHVRGIMSILEALWLNLYVSSWRSVCAFTHYFHSEFFFLLLMSHFLSTFFFFCFCFSSFLKEPFSSHCHQVLTQRELLGTLFVSYNAIVLGYI